MMELYNELSQDYVETFHFKSKAKRIEEESKKKLMTKYGLEEKEVADALKSHLRDGKL